MSLIYPHGFLKAGANEFVYFGTQDDIFGKLNPDGTLAWKTTLSNPNVRCAFSDGFIYVAEGSTLRKYNPDGTEVTSGNWPLSIGDTRSIARHSSGDLIVGGGQNGMYVKRVDASGNVDWTYSLSGSFGAHGVASDPSGNVFVANGTADEVIKLNSSGSFQWNNTDPANTVQGVASDSNGNCYQTGNEDVLRKINSSGITQWTISTGGYNTVGVGTDENDDIYYAKQNASLEKVDSSQNSLRSNTSVAPKFPVHVSAPQNVYTGEDGGTNSDIWKLDSSLNILWTYNGSEGSIFSITSGDQ